MYLKISLASTKKLHYPKYIVEFEDDFSLTSVQIFDQKIDFIYNYDSTDVNLGLNRFLINQFSRIRKYLINVF